MKNTISDCFIIVTLAILLAGCGKTPVEPNDASDDYFPYKAGAEWVYQVTNNIDSTTTEVTVFVNERYVLPSGDTAEVWAYKRGKIVYDFRFVVRSNDTVKAYTNTTGEMLAWLYVLPFEAGESWHYSLVEQTSHPAKNCNVLDSADVTVPAGQFSKTSHAQTLLNSLALDPFEVEDIWFAPNIGIVKIEHRSGFRVVDSSMTWELISYTL